MEPYLQDWVSVLQGMSNDNTYKLAWGRAIIESILLSETDENSELYSLDFSLIAEKILKYYWNQIFFFGLRQSPSAQNPPVIYSITINLISFYKQETNSSLPIWYNQAMTFFHQNERVYSQAIRKIVSRLRVDVCWRFLLANGQQYKLYELDERKMRIVFTMNAFKELKDYGVLLTQLINYKWAQLLEQFNRIPKIVSKIKGSQDNQIRRKNLSKFRDILLQEYSNGRIVDFYTDEIIEMIDVSIDHVIPWSFMYSDDVWNLVITSKSKNSQKSNNVPKKVFIEKLLARNDKLLNIIDDLKIKNELLIAKEQNYVSKYYYDLIS
jgi:hypothetical protein